MQISSIDHVFPSRAYRREIKPPRLGARSDRSASLAAPRSRDHSPVLVRDGECRESIPIRRAGRTDHRDLWPVGRVPDLIDANRRGVRRQHRGDDKEKGIHIVTTISIDAPLSAISRRSSFDWRPPIRLGYWVRALIALYVAACRAGRMGPS